MLRQFRSEHRKVLDHQYPIPPSAYSAKQIAQSTSDSFPPFSQQPEADDREGGAGDVTVTGGAPTYPAGLVAASLAHGFGLFVAVSVGANISGGHVNPAVTFGAFVGGNITLLRWICYIIAHLLWFITLICV